MKINYDINGTLYKVAFSTIVAGSVSAGMGTSRLVRDADYGLELLVSGLVVVGASFIYRHICKSKNVKYNSQLPTDTDANS